MSLQSGKHPDYIVIKPAPNVDIGDMAGEWLDRNQHMFIEIAVELTGCRMIPTPDLEISAAGEVAQVFLVEKVH